MSRRHIAQREWLVEDLEQIQRYFPGAELIEPLDMPFDIEAQPTPAQRKHERKIRAHSASGGREGRRGWSGLLASEAMLVPDGGASPSLKHSGNKDFSFCPGVTQ